jgi:hypothetical protein
VPSPSPGTDSSLLGVAATPAGTAWAVGYTGSGRTLILRWNGTAWTTVPSPDPGTDNYLYGVVATPAGTAWAVGYTESTNTSTRTLILRWNGTAWTTVPSPNPGTDNYLYSVAATPAGTAWAVGCTVTGCGTGASARTLILRWNGTAWTRVPSPGPDARLLGVAALSGSDAWAVGIADGKTLILHWNGQMWSGPVGQVSPAAAPASPSAPSAVSSPAPSATPAPTSAAAPPPTQVNLQGVTIGISAVNADPDAMEVAATLAAYFGGIDARNYKQAWGTYTSALQVAFPFQKFSSGERTSQDTQIVVQSIQHDSNGDLVVQVGFQSHQAGQYGINPGETCTNWSLDYHLVASPGAQPSATASPSYLINRVTYVGAGHTSC